MANKKQVKGHKSLEIAMIDVLDGMEEAACYIGYKAVAETVEILSIEPPGKSPMLQSEVLSFSSEVEQQHAHIGIVDYLIKRELRHIA